MGYEQRQNANPLWAYVILRGLLLGGAIGLLVGGGTMLAEVGTPWGWGGVLFGAVGGLMIGLLVGLASSVAGVLGHTLGAKASAKLKSWAAFIGACIGAAAVFGLTLRGHIFDSGAVIPWIAIACAGLLGVVMARPLRVRTSSLR